MKTGKRWNAALCAGLLTLLLGCSGQAADGDSPTAASAAAVKGGEASSGEKIELKIFKYGGVTLTPAEVKAIFADPVAARYPNIAVKLIDVPEGSPIEPLLTQGIVPDIIFAGTGSYQALKQLDLVEDLAPYKVKFGYDESRLKPVVNDAVRQATDGNMVPFSINLPVLYYNKDIFDKFGVPYPTEPQTWDQVLDTARQLTRDDGGTHYVGIDLSPSRLASGLSLNLVDPATGKADVTTPEWVDVFNVLKRLYEIPGFIGPDGQYQYMNKDDIFYVDRNIAMYPHNLAQLVGPLEELRKKGITMNWDFAPQPNFAEALGTSLEINVHSMALSKGSKHKDEAYQVMNLVLSDSVQRILTRNGRVSVLNDPKLEQEFGADIGVLKGKTIANIFKTQPRALHATNIYEGQVSKYLNDAAKSVALEGTDVNTVLRTAQDRMNKDLETLEKTSPSK